MMAGRDACTGVQGDAVAISTVGSGPSAIIRGPHGRNALACVGSRLVLEGIVIECRGGPNDTAVYCGGNGCRVDLSECTITNPEGTIFSAKRFICRRFDELGGEHSFSLALLDF